MSMRIRSGLVAAALSVLLLAAEVTLRLRGWLEIPVYVADARYEYMYAPVQNVYAGPIHVRTNSLGMRSAEPRKARKRVLFIGDSVINGTDRVTHDSLATTLLEPMLCAALGTDVQVLNISAASWGPDNAVAFLNAHGMFDADVIVAVFSSHDAFDNMDFVPTVGVHPGYPEQQPLFALQRLPLRLGFVRMPEGMHADDEAFNPGWRDLTALCAHHGMPLLVVHHAERAELANGRWHPAGTVLEDSLKVMGAPAVDARGYLLPEHYADFIHMNARGHRALAGNMLPLILPLLQP